MPTINLRRATQSDIEVFEGDSIAFDFLFEDDNDVLQPIADWTFIMDFKNKDPHCHLHCGIGLTDVQFSMSKKLGDGLTISYIGTLTGNFKADLWPGNYKYNLIGTDGSGVVTTWLYGTTKVFEVV